MRGVFESTKANSFKLKTKAFSGVIGTITIKEVHSQVLRPHGQPVDVYHRGFARVLGLEHNR